MGDRAGALHGQLDSKGILCCPMAGKVVLHYSLRTHGAGKLLPLLHHSNWPMGLVKPLHGEPLQRLHAMQLLPLLLMPGHALARVQALKLCRL